jgi:hypothetical protein
MNPKLFQKICILCLLSILAVTLTGCRTVHHYLYEKVQIPMFEGELYINVSATPKDNDLNGKRLTEYGAPYHLDLRYQTGQLENLEKMYVNNVSLVGQVSGRVISLSSREREYGGSKHPYEDPDIKSVYLMLGYENEVQEWTYEPYVLNFSIRIYRDDEKYDEKHLNILLKKHYSESKRSDLFDTVMSI